MKFNQWTLGLAAVGVISLPSMTLAEEAQHPVMTALQSTTISGYVDTSAIWQFGSGNIVPGRSFDSMTKQDGFNLNVVKLQIEKPLDEGQWSAGYSVGLLFGPDANSLSSTSPGLWAATSDFAIKNAYVTLRAPVGNGLDFKVGVWDSIIGYEVFEAGNNPNYSRSYGFSLEPWIHTGILATYKVNDILAVAAGVANRGDINTINARSGIESVKSYMGLISVTAPEGSGFLTGSTLYAGVVKSGMTTRDPVLFGGSNSDVMNYYVGGTMPTPVEGLTVGAAYDYRGRSQGDNGLGAIVPSNYANAVAGYLSYQATEKLRLNSRLEYATGSTGTWYASPAGSNNELLGVTVTADYSLWANVVTRGEFRWDRELHGNGIFNDGSDKNALSLALNVIYKF
ncbi:MAG: hypothetical protein FJ387_21665 [Verrucomicrobia bacterium]|nr:hypothetical protein [Verrucomicrobiota bacterium]